MFRKLMMLLGAVSLTMLVAVGFFYTMGDSATEAGESVANSSEPSVLINVENIRSDQGVIYGAVFADSDAFDNLDYQNAAAIFEITPKAGKASTSVNLPAGNYAIVVFHDENSNEDFDQVDGIPTEGYAYSNGAGVDYIVAFNDAQFTVAEASLTEGLTLIYY